MRIYCFLFSIIWFASIVSAQDMETSVQDSVPTYVIVDSPPQFPGGEVAMMKYISDNFDLGPMQENEALPSRIIVDFVLDTNGRPTQIRLKQSTHPDTDKQIIALIQNMPDWKPGEHHGKKVQVHLFLPIRIRWG